LSVLSFGVRVLQLERAELPDGHALLKHLIEVLERPPLHLRHAEEGEEERADGDAAVDEADLGLQVRVRRVEQVGREEGEEEACFTSLLAAVL
jgi:hypothetical protein